MVGCLNDSVPSRATCLNFSHFLVKAKLVQSCTKMYRLLTHKHNLPSSSHLIQEV
jgi:hypothetical protein